MLPGCLVFRLARADTQDMTTATEFKFEGIVAIKGSGMRGRRRAAARAHNARLRIALRPRDAQGRFIPTSERITSAVAAEAVAFETFIASQPGTIRANTVHIDQITIEGVWFNAADDTTHGHATCSSMSGVAFTTDAHATGWLCSDCITISPSVRHLAHDVATTIGTQCCTTCARTLGMKSFPTFVDSGYRMRGNECRKCRDARRKAARATTTPQAIAA